MATLLVSMGGLELMSNAGGFLVTQGVYSGPQDFKDKVVRHLMVSHHILQETMAIRIKFTCCSLSVNSRHSGKGYRIMKMIGQMRNLLLL